MLSPYSNPLLVQSACAAIPVRWHSKLERAGYNVGLVVISSLIPSPRREEAFELVSRPPSLETINGLWYSSIVYAKYRFSLNAVL